MRSQSWLFLSLALTAGAVEGTRAPQAILPPAVCFAPGTDPAYVARIVAGAGADISLAPPPESFQFNDTNRWGGDLLQGQPLVLTWSVVPDGTSIPATGGIPTEVTAPSNLRARLNAIYGSQAVWQPVFQQMFDAWGALTGTSYQFVNDDGAGFPGSGGSGTVRGDVRIGGHNLDGNFGVLAYNYFPNVGDMVIDTNDSFYTNTSNGSLGLRNVLAHEHGHGLGINHVCPVSQTKLMEPFLTTAFSGPQHDDTLAGQRGYGDDRENDDTAATGANLGTVGNGTFTANGGSLDDNADVDFVRFTVPAGKRLAATLSPVGSTYNQGPQNPTTGACPAGSPFNSLVSNDVAMEVRAPNGTTVLATANSQPAGQTETIPAFDLSAAGQYFIRVFGGTANTVQLYNLSFTISDGQLADLSITKTDGLTAAVPGTPATYTIVARNNSATLTVNGAVVTDTFPAGFTAVTWSCAPSAGSSCNGGGGTGNIARAVNLLPGGTATFTAAGTIVPGATGTLVNTATVAVPAGIGDPTPANNTATDTDTLTPTGDLSVTKTDGQASEVPGTPVTYTIVVTNPGPSTLSAVSVADTFPAAITGVGWTCAASGGATCAAPAGAGNIATTVTLPPAGSATFTATGTVAATATGTLANTATVAAAAGSFDPNLTNNSATDTDTLAPTTDLSVTNTDGQTSAVPGTPVSYTIVATNAGPSATVIPARVTAPFDPGYTGTLNWSCTATPGSSCEAAGGLSFSLNAGVTLAAGGSATIVARKDAHPDATGTLSNTVSIGYPFPGSPTDPNPANNDATDTDTLTPQADFSVTKTDGQLVAVPGSPIQYTIVVRQNGPSGAGAATVTDTLPAEITGATWTCSVTGVSTCPPSGAGNISTPVTLALFGTATFTLSGTVSPSATGTVANTASVAAPGGVTDTVPANDQATDTDNVSLDMSELVHASSTSRDLRAVGGVAAEHFYWLAQQPYSSYEIVVDATSGDIGPALQVERLAGDGSTVLQGSLGASALGFSRSLRVVNDVATAQASQLIRVRSGSCGTGCGPDDVYRIRMRETTGRIPRFNNSATQATVVVLQNTSDGTVTGAMRFWRANGDLAASQAFTLAPHALSIVNSSGIPGLAGTSGSVTVVHDGPYGALVGKSVALEPATGFSFDSSLVPLVR
jgi:uncharacterized repeat protein (TIGR01451 family)